MESSDAKGETLSTESPSGDLQETPKPEQNSYIAAGLGIGAIVTLMLSCCCAPAAFLSVPLGIGAAIMGFQVNKAVSDGEFHAVNKTYGMVGMIAGGVGILFGLGFLALLLLATIFNLGVVGSGMTF